MTAVLIAVGGLPGTGKSTLAAALGDRLGAPVLAKDVVEASLWRSGVDEAAGSWRVAHDLLATMTEAFVRQGLTVVIDAVFGKVEVRTRFADLATGLGVPFLPVECVCSDHEVHRTRIDGRQRGIPGWYELTWGDVEDVRRRFEPWTGDRLVVDAVLPLDDNVEQVLRRIG